MKKRIAILMVLIMAAAGVLAGCGSEDGANKDTMKIGLVQLVEHPSLDTIRESIIKQLEADGYKDGDNITIDYQNAQNEQANLKTICQGFVADRHFHPGGPGCLRRNKRHPNHLFCSHRPSSGGACGKL